MKSATSRAMQNGLPRISPAFLKLFAAYTHGYMGKHFHSLRVLKDALPPALCARPMVFYLNHAAWWDPLVCLLLARHFLPKRSSFAPIDSTMLARYGIFRKLGFFGIEPRSANGARTFLRTAHAVLASSGNALWLTPQGRFMDARERPLRFEEGLGKLATREPEAAFVPLAIEYSFWTEPRPEILVAFGEPIVPGRTTASASDWTRELSGALERAQDELAARSCKREAAAWQTLLRGKRGIGVFYDVWRQLCARLRGRSHEPEHSPENTR